MVVEQRTKKTNNMTLIDGLTLSSRAVRMRDQYLEAVPCITAERAVLATQSWQETEGQSLDIRRAKLLKKVCEGVTVAVFPPEKLVGDDTGSFRGIHLHPEYTCSYLALVLQQESDKVDFAGPVETAIFSAEDRAATEEVLKFWRRRTPHDRIRERLRELMGTWWSDYARAGVMDLDPANHDGFVPLYKRVLEEGLRSFMKEAEERIQTWRDDRRTDVEKLDFWQASILSCEAVITLAHRYAEKAKEMASTEENPEWRAELLEIARTCEWVPENPARTFREGLQSILLVCTALSLESQFQPAGWGRMDQYLYPLFQRDLAEGRLTLEEAAELVVDFYFYCVREELVIPRQHGIYYQRGQLSSVGLAGTDENGKEASNELTYLFLHVMGLVKCPEPHLVIGWTENTPDWLMRKALETNWKTGGGIPQFQNCDHLVDLMVRRGISLEDARNWYTAGCSQIDYPGQGTALAYSFPNVALYVDMALHNGIASKTGKQLGPETGDPRTFKTFEELYKAFQIQAEHMLRKQIWHDGIVDRTRGEYFRQPLASTLLAGPLEKGMDLALGGCRSYRMHFVVDRGHIPAADSLTAVKKLVYEEKKLSMAELLEAIDSDFAGQRGEEIRQMCLAAPKYGNDIDEADFMVRDNAKFTANVILSMKNIFGYTYAVNRSGEAWHVYAGERLAALPNGRRAGEYLADGSLSPTQGVDRNGPTAVLNSAIKANFKEDSVSGVMTLMFSAHLVSTPEMQEKLIDLTKSFMEQGGTYIQYNILDAEQLRDAKIHPEKHRDLLVRVGGYSAYFINLDSRVQDDIICRTEQSLA